MAKKIALITFVLLIFSLGTFILVKAAEVPPPPPPCVSDGCNGIHGLCQPSCSGGAIDPDCDSNGCCGDNIVQSPNSEDKSEKCDTGIVKGYCANDENIPCQDDNPCSGFSCLARMKGFCTDSPNSSECWRDSECASGHKCVFSCTAECGARLLGWAWSDNFGWLSLNSDNCLERYVDSGLLELYICSETKGTCSDDGDCDGGSDVCVPITLADICEPMSSPYYVQATSDNEIKGFAWSDNIGYICFGSSCEDNPPVGTLAEATLDFDDPQNPQIIGWAQAVNLPDNNWFSLNCESDSSCISADCSSYPNQPSCVANGCFYDDDDEICLSPNYQVRLIQSEFNGTCSGTPAKKCDPKNSECDPAEDPYCCDTGEGSCVSESRLTLSGWSWNGNSSGSGLGWLQFNPPIDEILSWLQTRYGDIYAWEGLTGEQPQGYNATYRILSGGGIDRFLSAQGYDWWVSQNFGQINFPTPETRYSNILGQLDIDGLSCDFSSGNSCTNKYGNKVINLNDIPLANSQLLNGDIYYHDGDLEIGNAIEFKNGLNFESGAGTIIVNGDLTISQDIVYDESDALTKFRNLASVAWIVKGDLKILSNVRELAGNFVVIGNGSACSINPEVSPPTDEGCGQIFSCGDSSIKCEGRLTVSGLMMGRKFYFKRFLTAAEKKEAVIQGSELIIYDGRLLANNPPGLGDFAKALPIWRSGTFSQ